MQQITSTRLQSPTVKLCPGLLQGPPMRLEDEVAEEDQILDLEKQISEGRRNGMPVDLLIQERKRIYESWIERLDREIREKDEPDAKKLRQLRERAIKDYKWPT